MTYRKILLPLWGRMKDHAAMETAFKLAREYGAHVEALFVRPDPVSYMAYAGVGYELDGATIQYMVDAAVKAADEALKSARQRLQRLSADLAVPNDAAPGSLVQPSYELRVVQGDLIEMIERESRLCDLVIFSSAIENVAFDIREALEGALMSGARPVLFVSGNASTELGRNVAVGFDGSAAAAHAVTAALPFLTKAASVHAFEVLSDKDKGGTLPGLRAYLALRGIDCKEHVIERDGKTIGEAVVAAASAKGCDLLVIGGYGHSRLREFVLGGVTRHVLHHGPNMSVLMAH